MSNSGHIVHTSNKKTVQHNYRSEENGKRPKRGPNQINERPPRPHSSAIPKFATHARVPNNHQNPKIVRRLLRSKHYLPTPWNPGEERLR